MTYVDRPTFEKLLFDDIGRDEFFAEYWNRRPAVFRDRGNRRLTQWFPSASPHERVEKWFQRAKGDPQTNCTLVHAVDDGKRTASLTVGAGPAHHAYSEGLAELIVLGNAHRLDEEIVQLRTRILELGRLTTASGALCCAYIHPGGDAGARLHFDNAPLFQICLDGKRAWQVTKEPIDNWNRHPAFIGASSLLEFTHTSGEEVVLDPRTIELEEYVLSPGDILYLPPCTPHQTRSVGEPSLAVSFFMPSCRPADVLAIAMNKLSTPAWNAPVPRSRTATHSANDRTVDVDAAVERLQALSAAWKETVASEPELLREAIVESLAGTAELSPSTPIEHRRTVDADSVLRVPRQAPVFMIEQYPTGEPRCLRCAGHTFELERDEALGAALYEGKPIRPIQLAPLPEDKACAVLQELVDVGALEICNELGTASRGLP